MKAIEYAHFGGPEELEVKDVPAPVPADGEILIRVHAAAVNPVDWKILGGHMRMLIKGGVPRRGGCEFAGRVEQVAPGVRQFAPGDVVVGVLDPFRSRQGAFADYVSIPESGPVVRVPEGLSPPEAAALPIAGMSALDCLRRLGNAKTGQRVLIIGAAGGVGSFAVQLARLWGLHVTAVCREANAGFVRELGAHAVVAYDRTDPLRINEAFNLIVDAAAKYSYGRCAHLLTADGIYINTMPGPRTFFDTLRTRFFGRRRARILMLQISRASLEELVQLAAERKIKAVVSQTFPLEQTRAAYELSRTEHARGKIVVLVEGGRV